MGGRIGRILEGRVSCGGKIGEEKKEKQVMETRVGRKRGCVRYEGKHGAEKREE